jgi:hypothetical protein
VKKEKEKEEEEEKRGVKGGRKRRGMFGQAKIFDYPRYLMVIVRLIFLRMEEKKKKKLRR